MGKFGRGAQFGDRISRGHEGSGTSHCGQCEAMLADALDGTLAPEQQAIFEAHIASCGPCEDMLSEARRGLGWLEMLRDPRPEPARDLLERILLQTSGMPVSANAVPHTGAMAVPARGVRGSAVRWPEWLAGALRGSALLQPRLAMTAAMAFFSIAVTMNLTGVRLSSVRAGDLTPSGIRRAFYRADARMVQYYEGLRVVYELESRVHELETDPDAGGPADSGAAPAPSGAPAQPAAPSPENRAKPAGGSPSTPGGGSSSPQPPAPGSSRRENLFGGARIVATSAGRGGDGRSPGGTI